MKRFFLFLVAVAAVCVIGYFRLQVRSGLPDPLVVSNPTGISQRTIRELRIGRQEWLSPDAGRVWVTARSGPAHAKRVALLVELESGRTLYSVEDAEPVAWLNDRETLFTVEGGVDPAWKKFARKTGGSPPREYRTLFYRFDSETGEMVPAIQVDTEAPLTFFSIAKDRKWAVGTWGPLACYELDFENDQVSERVEEDYVWAPRCAEEGAYLFVGETAIQSRKMGESGSERISQPLLDEIRDAIIRKGTPSLQLCGVHRGEILAVDHHHSRSYDRLLRIDARTSLVEELTRLAPSNQLPRFDETGHAFVYQGHLFEGNMDTVFYQELEPASEPGILVEGKQGDVHEASPLFIDPDTCLYAHWGRELQTVSLIDGAVTLHWPIDLNP